MNNTVIEITDLKKSYKLGQFNSGSLTYDLQSWWAKKRGKEDPNKVIGYDDSQAGQIFWALKGINLKISQGERVGIIGGNGAGKSTLLKILARITAPTDGNAIIRGRIASMLEVGTGFNPEMTGRENIYLNGAILGMSKVEIDNKLDEIIKFSECEDFIDTPVKRYSSGMYVKLAFSVAAHLDSEIIIMDEVLAVGDAQFQKKCLNKMRDSSTIEGKTVLYVSHNMSTIRQLCSRCIVLKHGKKIFDGNVDEAIQVYMEEAVSHDMERTFDNTANQPQMKKANILNFKILDKDTPEFDSDEKIKFSIRWQAFNNLDNMRLRCLLYTCGTPIATCISPPVSALSGEVIENIYEMDISALSKGDYYFDFYLGDYSPPMSETYAQQINVFGFSVNNNCNQFDISWNQASYGYFALNPLKVITTLNSSEL